MTEPQDLLGPALAQMRDVAYTAVGLGVLGFQQAQVRRRELAGQLEGVERIVGPLIHQIDSTLDQLDESIQPVERYLPFGARAVLGQLRSVRSQLRGDGEDRTPSR
jgi:hypothetical protein